ncbi:hypothetical protein GM661_09465 [Iocasia frigidifontis]|uniref:Uncharacterized protein n=1 Tax=Iocasia fonsfrigidae TaxID=2682810 RepID=A0A8A7K9Q4_9FIRM|nr:hypothetical protein [Iocasia fonsfrigidae]QTL98191.1 hypothetical protein GM661_09465 [Iocasia fonsfrigidae]
MILCLDRKQRLAFILGSIFSTNSKIAGEIIGISPVYYRKLLSRARSQLKSYLDGRCSLLNKNGSCKCVHKTNAAIKAGYINPDNLQFEAGYVKKVKDFVKQYSREAEETLTIRFEQLFKEQPFWESPDYKKFLNQKIKTMEMAWRNLNK